MIDCLKQKSAKVWKDGDLNKITYGSANWLSRLTFWWVNAFFKKGYLGQLSDADVPTISDVDDCSRCSEQLQRYWDDETTKKQGRQPRLGRAVFRSIWKAMIFPTLLFTIADVQKLLQPYLIGQLLGYLYPNTTMPMGEALLYAGGLGLSGFIFLFTAPFVHFILKRISLRLRSSICGLVYRKVLRLNCKALHGAASGRLINILSTDVEKFNRVLNYLPLVICTPIETAIVFYFLYQYVGVACFFALAAIVIMIPISSLAGYIAGRLRARVADWADRRIGVMNETLSAIKLVKMYCWEEPLSQLVHWYRKKEIRVLRKSLSIRQLALSVSSLTMRISTASIFIGQWALGRNSSTASFYIAMGWLSIVSFNFKVLFTIYSREVAEMLVALNRITAFLLLTEDKNKPDHYLERQIRSCEWAVDMRCVGANWVATSEEKTVPSPVIGFHLEDISIKVKKGELLAVVGPVGSGKTSLLLTLLGELPVDSGFVHVNGNMTFAPQIPWVFHDTVRENILIGDKLDENRYKEVLNACALLPDIEKMSCNDYTLVGEKGLMLSGGQKTRMVLARAVYKEADIYLLDDPLSAVDAEVGRHLFEKCISGYLKNKTRILATHQLQYLKSVDRIILMREGRISDVGTYDELLARGIQLTTYLSEDDQEDVADNKMKESNFSTKHAKKEKKKKEDQEIGDIGIRVYWEYIKATKAWFLMPCFLVLAIGAEALLPLADVYFIRWTESCGTRAASNSSPPLTTDVSNSSYSSECDGINVNQRNYFITFGSSALVNILSLQLFAWFIMTASQTLHDQMFPAVLKAKMRFFDTNPAGRILNRFSRDIGLIDSNIPRLTAALFTTILQLLGMIIMICVVNPWMLIPLIPIAIVMVMVKRYCGKTTTDMKRIAAVAKSPVFSHVSDTLFGLQCIRTYKLVPRFIRQFDQFQNFHTSALFLYHATFRGFGFKCLLVVVIFLNIAVFSSVILKKELEAGLAALSFVYIISFADPFELFMRKCCMYENRMTSVERVLAYTKLDQEADEQKCPAPNDWPSSGEITFTNLSMKYFDGGPTVLKDITCRIEGGEKIGVVGRTGAGKSSILAILLRMAEFTGRVYIDGVDINSVSLRELRDQISVIPQDPIMFSGNLRKNLDLLTHHSDEHIWKLLEEVHLKDVVDKLPGKLYTEISEGGLNFSVGERQLLCLVRTILRRNRILILDEATANVDLETDDRIRDTIRRWFAHCTVITIAHRLHTIMDSDRVMLMENGVLKEFDSPHILLKDEGGSFSRLVDQTGKESATHLQASAKRSFDMGNPGMLKPFDAAETRLRKPSIVSYLSIDAECTQEPDNLESTQF